LLAQEKSKIEVARGVFIIGENYRGLTAVLGSVVDHVE
jgi:hypothetical protein